MKMHAIVFPVIWDDKCAHPTKSSHAVRYGIRNMCTMILEQESGNDKRLCFSSKKWGLRKTCVKTGTFSYFYLGLYMNDIVSFSS